MPYLGPSNAFLVRHWFAVAEDITICPLIALNGFVIVSYVAGSSSGSGQDEIPSLDEFLVSLVE